MAEPVFHLFEDGPVRVAPYSHAVEAGDWLFVTGQMPIRDDGSVPATIEEQTDTVIDNLVRVIERAGFATGDIVSARVYLTHFERDYARMNTVYAARFPPERRPARTCVGVTALARGCDIEIDMIVKRHS